MWGQKTFLRQLLCLAHGIGVRALILQGDHVELFGIGFGKPGLPGALAFWAGSPRNVDGEDVPAAVGRRIDAPSSAAVVAHLDGFFLHFGDARGIVEQLAGPPATGGLAANLVLDGATLLQILNELYQPEPAVQQDDLVT